jgi:VWFA-related protein
MDILAGFGRTPAAPSIRPVARTVAIGVLVAAVALLSAVAVHAHSPQAAARPQAQPQPQQQEPPRPVFRAGANFVRVDAYVTKDGQAVTDLKAEDFEVLEDGKPQAIETFEHVVVQTGTAPATRVEPRTVQESNQAAADPRARVFVIFLDTGQMTEGNGYAMRRPLTNLLTRVIGDQDLVALMTPEMSALDIVFTRRTDNLAARLQQLLPTTGERGRLNKLDPVEQMYEYCYPKSSTDAGMSTSDIAQAMINRRREKRSLDALRDLIIHLDGLREERKAILVVSEGWVLYTPSRSLAEISIPSQSTMGVGPTGRLGSGSQNTGYGGTEAQCDQDRIRLANLDNARQFRTLLEEANRANATFYPIDPGGLRVFDTDISEGLTLTQDASALGSRLTSLREAAENTDGVAVINSNNIEGGLQRVVADLTSYYLLGYTSTNSKLDGRFRSIKVRAKRPGTEVRARRGYRAPTEAEVAERALARNPPAVDEARAATDRAVASLDARRPDAPFRLIVSPGWWTPTGPPMPGKPAGAEPAFWIYGNVDMRRPGGDDWSQGGEAEIAIQSAAGETVTTYTVPVAAQSGAFESRFPRSDEDVWLDPGSYAVRVRVKAAGGIPTTDTMRFELPKAADPPVLAIGEPMYARRGMAASSKEVRTADLQFRRQERIVVELSATMTPESVTGELLDRKGNVLTVPVAATTVQKDGAVWVRGELALTPLAAGDYIIRLTAVKGAERRGALAPFRVVP